MNAVIEKRAEQAKKQLEEQATSHIEKRKVASENWHKQQANKRLYIIAGILIGILLIFFIVKKYVKK